MSDDARFFQAEDGIRDRSPSRGLGDVYKRQATPHFALGAGIHFCVGAPLARLELQKALPILFKRCPNISIINPPVYANLYHFHGLTSLKIKP